MRKSIRSKSFLVVIMAALALAALLDRPLAQMSGGPGGGGGGSVGPTTPLQVQSLGVNTPAPATAGDIELLDATGGNTTHMCIGLQSNTYPGIGFGSCPVSWNNFGIGFGPNTTYVNGPTEVILAEGGFAIQAVTATTASFGFGVAIQSTGGVAPTLTAGCNGAGSSVTAGSTNNRGKITTQTAASTSCTITWSASGVWNQAPFCVFMGTPGLTPGACGTSTCVVNFTSISAATPLVYVCM
jgi:hypothetical protein